MIRRNPVRFTPEGGLAIRLTNKTGAASVKGTLVAASTATANAFAVTAAAGALNCIGAVYESGVPDGAECWVVVAGIAEVLLKDSTASTLGYWVKTSEDTAGRADATSAAPSGGTVAALEDHAQEIGHCLETKTGGTNVLAKIVMHFN